MFSITSTLCISTVLLATLAISVHADQTVCDFLCDCHPAEDSLSVLCSRKSLTRIPQDIPVNVTNLDLSLNTLPILESKSFPHLPQLRSLNLQLSSIERLEDEVFRNLPTLQEVQLNHNALSSIASSSFHRSRSVHLLSLDHNQLESLPDFLLSGLHLESLSLQDNNQLTFLAPTVFYNVSVEVLSLDRCNLSGIEPSTLRPLVNSLHNLMWSYSLQNVSIHKQTFDGFNFKMLNLIKDGLTSLEFLRANFTVQNLDVSYNRLGEVDLSHYHGLQATETLTIKASNISLFTASSLTDLHLLYLHQLDISQNKLVSLDHRLFQHMSSLKRLTLTANFLTSVPVELQLPFSNLEMIDVYGMELECDCRLDWFRSWIQSSTSSVIGAHCSDGVTDLAHVGPLPCKSPEIKLVHAKANSSSVHLSCSAEAIPTPSVYWLYTDNAPVIGVQEEWRLLAQHTNSCNVLVQEVVHCISVQCVAENVMGKDFKTFHACIETPAASTTTPFESKSTLSVENKIGWAIGGGLIAVVLAVILVIALHNDVRRYIRILLWRRPISSARTLGTSSVCLVQDSDDEATFVLAPK